MANISKDSLSLSSLFSKWIDESLSSKSIFTVKTYRDSMLLYMQWLESIGVECTKFSKEAFSRENIILWIEWLKNSRNSNASTCNNRLSAIRSYLKYISLNDPTYLELYLSSKTIAKQIHVVQEFEYISKDAVKTILSVPKATNKKDYKYLVLMSFLYSTAARINEALSIKVKDLHLDVPNPYVTVAGKGRKIRTLYLTNRIVQHLKAMLAIYHGNDDNGEAYVWFSNVKGPMSKVSQEGVNKKIKQYANIAKKKCSEVPDNFHAHSFRHARATHLLEDGMKIYTLQRFLGHENLATTSIYTTISPLLKEQAIKQMDVEDNGTLEKKWKNSPKLTDLFNPRKLK